MPADQIELRGVHVNNLKNVDLDIPHQELVVFCGVSGSGKTSLALDTLYAEGQRRYIESFSAYTRQFLERLEKPAAEKIEGIPPAIAVTHKSASASNRATVGTATEIIDYLRLIYARVGKVECHNCGRRIERDSPESAASRLQRLPEGSRYMIAYPATVPAEQSLAEQANALREDGFVRWIVGDRILSTDQDAAGVKLDDDRDVFVIVDRLTGGRSAESRVRESVETAMGKGAGRCSVFLAGENGIAKSLFAEQSQPRSCPSMTLDDRPWIRVGFSNELACEDCKQEFPRLEPRLFSFNSPLGACPECEGFGNVMDVDLELIVPNPNKSLSEGAIAPWNTPAYKHELEELLALADDFDIPVHTPFRELEPRHLRLITEGIPERDFGGLNGFFAWLERRKYKMHIRVFLSRWRSYRECPSCHGARLRPEALSVKVAGYSIADLCRMKINDAVESFGKLELSDHERSVSQMLLEQAQSRLAYLSMVGLGYLTLERSLRTLSGGEAQRVSLTSALGSSLVNMLYVLDEPSVGLHPTDVDRLLNAIEGLRNRGNTVVVVEHEESMIQAADRIVEIGPGAGDDGGEVMFEGTADELCDEESGGLTGDYLARRRGYIVPENRRDTNHGWVKLTGASGNNLKKVDAEFPLGVLCVVSGVSGSGKSSLVDQTLYPALARRKRKDAGKPLPYDEIIGDGQFEDVILVDQSPIGRSPRSNPVTYIKAFDAIRKVFAETLSARTRNLKTSHFSFNVEGGRCEACKGDGSISINMQFLADVVMTCSECQGKRYRRDVLDVKYRDRSIADVLGMTVRQAHSFFRGQPKVQSRLHQLIDVGLEYLRLGQSASTLSAGEAQRLKLAGYLSASRRGRTLFLLDEPTTGLHFSDIVQLLDCFFALLDAGHSLIVIEHNLQVMQSADYIIDLGPGAADAGGQIVAAGTPEEVARNANSATGRSLAGLLTS
ncbi:MAG: excinuclease ABC subunit UvrA [Planctomycetota bacterium]